MSECVWVPDRKWRVVSWPQRCSCAYCPEAAVAEQVVVDWRGRRRRRSYCPEHLTHFRRIEGDSVLLAVAAGSPAHERGYVE